MVKVIKKNNKNDDGLLNEFNRACSRFVKYLRRHRYLEKKPSQHKKRQKAIISDKYRKQNEKNQYYD